MTSAIVRFIVLILLLLPRPRRRHKWISPRSPKKEASDFTTTMVKDDLERDKMLKGMYLKIIELEANMEQAQMIRTQQATN